MVSENLKREAREAWLEYEKAFITAFHLPAGSKLAADELENTFANSSDESISALVKWVRRQTEEVRTMKFVGEP